MRNNSQKYLTELSRTVGDALELARIDAHETARRYGTPVYIMQDGEVTAIEPMTFEEIALARRVVDDSDADRSGTNVVPESRDSNT